MEAVRLGRTFVHCTVGQLVASAYSELALARPDARFVYGETGLQNGGLFEPHKTHQNGLSVDFFVPVRDAEGRATRVSASEKNRWGYDVEFDSQGRFQGLVIDFELLAQHLLAITRAAEARGVGIRRVYLDVALQRQLHRTESWGELERRIPFSRQQGWWRHDEHYHVDFELPCRPL